MGLEFAYAPLFRVHVVAPAADVLDEAQRDVLVGDEEERGGLAFDGDSLRAEVGKCLLEGEFRLREGIGIEVLDHRQGVLRRHGLAALLADSHTVTDADELGGEVLNQLFVFQRVSGNEAVLLPHHPAFRMAEPAAEHVLLLDGLGGGLLARLLALGHAERIDALAVLAESADIQPFAAGLVRIEMVSRAPLGDTPRGVVADV